MNVNSLITKDYRKKDDFSVRINKPNSNPIFSKPKMNVNAFSQKDYENETTLMPQKNKPKQSQNKPKQSQNKPNFKPCPERSRMGRMGQFQTAGKRTKEAKKKKRISGTFLRLLLAGEIDFLDGYDILL